MTKREILNIIEESQCVVDFDRKYLMRKTKDRLEDLLERVRMCQAVQAQRRAELAKQK